MKSKHNVRSLPIGNLDFVSPADEVERLVSSKRALCITEHDLKSGSFFRKVCNEANMEK